MKDVTQRLLAAMNYQETATLMIDLSISDSRRMITQILGMEPPPSYDSLVAIAKEEMLQKLPHEIAKLYEDTFTDDELEEMLRFFESSVNKKLYGLLPAAAQIGRKLSDEFAQNVLSRAISHQNNDIN